MQDDIDIKTIKKRALRGVMSLTFRRVALQVINFFSINIILARFVSPETLGIFNIGASIIAFFAFFSDIGLAAALIQKKERPSQEHLTTTFSIQQFLVGCITAAIFVFAPKFASLYGLDQSGMWLIRALAISFFLSSLKVIPSVLLERELKFDLLVIPEILETIAFNGLLIGFTMAGYNLWAFVIASLVRGLIGTVIMYGLAPWRVGLGLSRGVAKDLLSFGIPFQMNSVLALLKDRVVPLFVAKVVGASAIGFITWAQALAFLPLEVMNIAIRIMFPTYARLQEDKGLLTRAVEKSLYLTTLFLYPMLAGLMGIMPGIVLYIVHSKWQPAVPSFYLFTLAAFWGAISTTCTNALNATGHIKVTLRLMVFWTVITWILTPILVVWMGFIGVGVTSAIISFTSILTVIEIKKIIPVRILPSIGMQVASSVFMGGTIYILTTRFVHSAAGVFSMVGLGFLIYLVSILFLDGKRVVREVSSIVRRHE
ncbi:MAG TPA: oligosaccharide flippase family protein [Patescibacteria group bacterium]|nr:oligosaccharide flippase family protein [Patescibacteria group bacterium]